jgi:hypothetical protein
MNHQGHGNDQEQGDKIGYFDTSGNWVWGLSE